MITRANRFHGHNSLRPIYQKGRPIYSANIKLLYAPAQRPKYRAAVVVSKKVHKSAVVRNRIRRRIYEAVRLFMATTEAQYDLVFVVQTAQVADMSVVDIQNELQSLLKKATSST